MAACWSKKKHQKPQMKTELYDALYFEEKKIIFLSLKIYEITLDVDNVLFYQHAKSQIKKFMFWATWK